MKTKISYLDFARPFKYNKDFFVLCHMALEVYAADNKVRFDLNSEKVLRYYWRYLIENDEDDNALQRFKYFTHLLIEHRG